MSGAYYSRAPALHLDGSPIFATAEDRAAESKIQGRLEMAWNCTLSHFGPLSPIDWYATRDGRLVGVLELKHRSHAKDRYPTVFLNVRKWLALSLASVGLGVPALFVVQWELDQVGWAVLSTIDASKVIIGGCNRIVKAGSDVEPVIEIPVSAFLTLVK
jgi:hypothetical protein